MRGRARRISSRAPSRCTLGCKAWMNDRAVASERRRFDDLVIPIDRQRSRVLIHEDLQEGEKVPGVKTRSGRGDAARHVVMADDLDAARFHDFAGLGELAIAAALHRE